MKRRTLAIGLLVTAALSAGLFSMHKDAYADATEAAAALRPAFAGGPHAFVKAALAKVDLREDQRPALAQLEADVLSRSAPVREAHARVMEAVAASVEAGAVDHATIDPLVAAARAAAVQSAPVFEDAANRLHAILDAGQREQLIGALREQMMAHAHQGAGGHLAAVAARLGLSEEQIATIHGRAGAPTGPDAETKRAHLRHMHEVAAAFVSDSFDAHALGIGSHLGAMGGRGDEMLRHLEAALPVLTQEQRANLAQLIRSGEIAHPEAPSPG